MRCVTAYGLKPSIYIRFGVRIMPTVHVNATATRARQWREGTVIGVKC